MPFQKNVRVQRITEKDVRTKWGLKKSYLLWVEGEKTPYSTWNQTFAKALNAQKGKLIRISYEVRGQYRNLVVPGRFKGHEGKWNLILDKLSSCEERIKNIEKQLRGLIQFLQDKNG